MLTVALAQWRGKDPDALRFGAAVGPCGAIRCHLPYIPVCGGSGDSSKENQGFGARYMCVSQVFEAASSSVRNK